MRSTPGIALAALLLVSMTGCASHKAAASETTTTAAVTDGTTTAAAGAADAAAQPAAASADAANASSDDKAGAGHVSLTGEFAFEHDFVVDGCQIAPAGDGLLSGYHMTSKDGPPIAMIAVTLKDFTNDGPYVQAASSPEQQVGQAMKSGIMGPLMLMIMKDETTPMAFGQVAGSKLTITISDSGAKGVAEFTDLESQITMADIDPNSSAKPRGKRVSGSVTWACGSVGRINAQMNGAVNGMFKKLIPPR